MLLVPVVSMSLVLFVGISLQSYPDEIACVGDKQVGLSIGSPDDPLKVSFECKGSGEFTKITSCSLNGVAVEPKKHKTISLKNGNKYKLYCYSYLNPSIFEQFAARICKTDDPKATVDVIGSDESIEVSFECNWLKSKISKCKPAGESKEFSTSDKEYGRFGGLSGRKYIIHCDDLYSPYIREDYSAERCFSQSKFSDTIAVSGSPEKIDVEFTCAGGQIAQCRPDSGKPISSSSNQYMDRTFTKGKSQFKLNCYSTSVPVITPISA